MSVVRRTLLTSEPISLIEHEQLVDHDSAGALVGFVGNVRDHDGGRAVSRLEYSAHPSAPQVLANVVEELVTRVDGVRGVAVSHRIGTLTVGEAAFVVVVSADHRREAFVACQHLVDGVKAALPVWKHQVFTDGTDEWVGSA